MMIEWMSLKERKTKLQVSLFTEYEQNPLNFSNRDTFF